jgi:hypothetical protein
MNSRFLFATISACFFYLNSVSQSLLVSVYNDLDSSSANVPWINQSTAIKGDAYSGVFYSEIDSVHPYSIGYKGALPKICRNKNLQIRISENVRMKDPSKETLIVMTLSLGDSLVVYNSKNISSRMNMQGIWIPLADQFDVPSSFTGKDYILAVYIWNKEGLSSIGIDNFKIDFLEKEMPTFLPSMNANNDTAGMWQKMDSNKYFSFYYNKESGGIKILDANGDTVVRSLAFYSEWINAKNETEKFLNYHFYFRKDSLAEEGNIIFLDSRDEISSNEIMISAKNDGKLSFNISSVFNQPVKLARKSLVTEFSMPITQVFKKNSLIDTIDLKNEYWLNKEGFILSGNKNALIIYCPEKISSIQLDVNNRRSFFNLDYSADHPMLHFPLMNRSEGKFEDYSTSLFQKEDTLNALFTFYPVKKNFKMIRMTSNPYGYFSSFIWTEHADYTNMRTQRAMYYGSENISSLEKATGGFLKYSIPVTKSIFYANPDKVDNKDKDGLMPGPVANYKETEGYRDFLRGLYEYGNEICLHTPDHFTCSRKLLSEALDATKKDFVPVTWIDHGYDNSNKSNREDLACDGADSTSEFYSADLWKKYGIKYFWNSFYEDSSMFADLSYNSFFSVPYSGWDDAMPTPIYWRHEKRTGDIVHWRTTNTMDPADGSLWSYFFNDLRLSDAVKNRNNIIIHCYPARVDSTTGFYSIQDGKIVCNENFNAALAKLSLYRAQEKIQLTTIREMLDYKTSLESILISVGTDGIISVFNSGKGIVRGVSFTTLAGEVNAGKKELKKKKTDNELIFWFDISPGEKVLITTK